MPSEHLDILRCPHTLKTLRVLQPDEIADLNHRIRARQVERVDGSLVVAELAAGLISSDDCFVYEIDEEIITMLPNLAIRLQSVRTGEQRTDLPPVTAGVQSFYDEIGWEQDEDENYNDAVQFEDLRAVSQDYIHKCHLRVGRHVATRGRYLLDVASGPVQYPQYLTYSAGYAKRICVDISRRALREARAKLGPAGIYILGDICQLPLQNGVVEGVVSLHTIYHVPTDSQAAAFREIHRVLAPGHSAAVVYSWGSHSPVVKAANLPARLLCWLFRKTGSLSKRIANRREAIPENSHDGPESEELYFQPQSYRWFVSQKWEFNYEIHSWRSVDIVFLRAYVHRRLFGQLALRGLFRLEEAFPHWLGRWGVYPLIVIHKTAAATPAHARAA